MSLNAKALTSQELMSLILNSGALTMMVDMDPAINASLDNKLHTLEENKNLSALTVKTSKDKP